MQHVCVHARTLFPHENTNQISLLQSTKRVLMSVDRGQEEMAEIGRNTGPWLCGICTLSFRFVFGYLVLVFYKSRGWT